MDFVSDALFDGRRLRALIIVDAFTRQALAISRRGRRAKTDRIDVEAMTLTLKAYLARLPSRHHPLARIGGYQTPLP